MESLGILFTIIYILCGKLSVVDSCQRSTMKWPLLPTTCKFEVLLSHIQEVHPLCRSLRFASSYPINTPNAKMAVEVSRGFFFDVDVAAHAVNDDIDYGISIYIYPRNESGPIFDYMSNDGFFQMAVWLDNGNLKAMRRISSSPEAYLVNDNILPVALNTWQKVGVVVDTSGKKLKTTVANNLQENSDSTTTKDKTGGNNDVNRPIRTPGVIRVGAMFNESVPRTFSGLVTCIGLVIDSKNLDCLFDCVQKSSWTFNSTFGNMANHYQATFKGVRSGEVPSEQKLHQSVTRSLITCSVICLRDFQTCRSFTYESQSNTCTLYSEIYTSNSDFIPNVGHIYYVLLSYV